MQVSPVTVASPGVASSASPNINAPAATPSAQAVAVTNPTTATNSAAQVAFASTLAQAFGSITSGIDNSTATALAQTLVNLATSTDNSQTVNDFTTQLLTTPGGMGNLAATNLLGNILGATSTTATAGTPSTADVLATLMPWA